MTQSSLLIEAPAETVYDLISNPMRMAEWSPECVRCRWTAGAQGAEIGRAHV